MVQKSAAQRVAFGAGINEGGIFPVQGRIKIEDVSAQFVSFNFCGFSVPMALEKIQQTLYGRDQWRPADENSQAREQGAYYKSADNADTPYGRCLVL